MALKRNFPVPSDRMAIISTLLNIEDAVVLEYGPEGTTHYGKHRTSGKRHFRAGCFVFA